MKKHFNKKMQYITNSNIKVLKFFEDITRSIFYQISVNYIVEAESLKCMKA